FCEMGVSFVHDTFTVNRVVPLALLTTVGLAPPAWAVARCAYCQFRSGATSPSATVKNASSTQGSVKAHLLGYSPQAQTHPEGTHHLQSIRRSTPLTRCRIQGRVPD